MLEKAVPVSLLSSDANLNVPLQQAQIMTHKIQIFTRQNYPFLIMHFLGFLSFFVFPITWPWLLGILASYYFRMLGVTIAYHRYFSHRSFKTSRVMQFVLAFWAQTSAQKGALWWAAHHRHHHKHSDQPDDLHSMKLQGFWYSHVGWILDVKNEEVNQKYIGDFWKYPELVWLNKWHWVPPTIYAVTIWLVGGWVALFWLFFTATVFVYHGTFFINSLSHWLGKKVYANTDESRNSWLLAIICCGEGWHNNHHHFQKSSRQGFLWWQIDLSFYVLKIMETLGLVWGLVYPPERLLRRV